MVHENNFKLQNISIKYLLRKNEKYWKKKKYHRLYKKQLLTL